jgi:hypothetical protein
VGRKSGRKALVLQFSAGGQPFGESIIAGTEQDGTLLFYPGASQQRARFHKRSGVVSQVAERIPGTGSIEEFLSRVSEGLARQPWLDSFGAVLHDVTVVPRSKTWLVRDRGGCALPLSGTRHWKMLAVSGGHPFDLTGEWDGRRLRPLGFAIDNTFRVV